MSDLTAGLCFKNHCKFDRHHLDPFLSLTSRGHVCINHIMSKLQLHLTVFIFVQMVRHTVARTSPGTIKSPCFTGITENDPRLAKSLLFVWRYKCLDVFFFFLISLKSLTLDPDPFGPFNRNSYLSQCSSQRAIEPPGFGAIIHDVEFESWQQHHHNVKCQNYLRDNLNIVLYLICVYVWICWYFVGIF